ncbi:hemicentin-2-like isoform X2 [Homarus americanus]|uniref:hemicentin-2-like isoform X2 n=1 Tax=Homarus americanus TaxID=6706 RepID=UPI001C472620|nr:hemicentin-2-like isoform X2 [Homarus americanus]
MKREKPKMSAVHTSGLGVLIRTLMLVLTAASSAQGEAVVSVVETLVERTVALPCKATLHPQGDTPNLLLFYRHSSNIPFFSYDARSGDFWREGSPKTRDVRYEGRVFLNLTQPQRVHLNLERVTLQDGGDFTCRVDFLSSPSLTSIVKLHVYANPSVGPTVRVGTGLRGTPIRSRTDVGPFHEGEMLNLSCTVTGGFPAPIVTWWQDLKLLDNSSYVISNSGPSQTVNELTVGPLTRQLVEVPFTCRSENNPLSSPMDRTVHLKIHMAPQSVVLGEAATVRAGMEERLECRAKGAYPEANITWTLDGKKLNFTAKETRQIGSDTVSWVQFVASPREHGAVLTCTASSSTLPDPPVSTNATLNVTHAPLVRLELGASLRPDHIRQGDDVYFDCLIVANPPVQRIAWYKEDTEVKHHKTAGVLVGGTNLVLQSVQRPDAGTYTCNATNAVAASRSNPFTLSIQYGPMCAQERVTVTAVEGEVVTLQCTVDAYPANVTFYWLFNNTVDSTRFRPSEYTVEGSVSRLRYVAYSARDYGTVFCWASNVVGHQKDPCAFTLQPAGAPDSVRDCVLTNQSAGSLHITCKPGADGGLTQTFRAEVYAGGSAKPVRVLEGMSPVFTLEGLSPGGDYVVTLTAFNRKGASPPVSLEAFTLKVAENRMISSSPAVAVAGVSSSQPEPEEGPAGAVSPLLGVFLGVVGAFLLLAAAAIFITRRHCSRGAGRTPDLVAGQELEVKGDTAEAMTSAKGELVDNSDLTEADPFLATSEGSTGTASTPASAGGGAVFTIPAHIPPPPQYCSASCNDLSPTQHALQHTSAPQHTIPCSSGIQHTLPRSSDNQHALHHAQGSQHSVQRSSPLQHCLQRSSSVERSVGRNLGSQHCLARASPPLRPQHHGTPATFSLQHPAHPQIIYTTGTDAALQQSPGVTQAPHPAAIHYVQPHPGLGGDAPSVITTTHMSVPVSHHPVSQHMGLGLAPSHLGSGPHPQRTLVSQGSIEHTGESPITHSSPKNRAKHVTWTGGPTHGEESAV